MSSDVWSPFLRPQTKLDSDLAKFIAMSRVVDGILDFDRTLSGPYSPREFAASETAKKPFNQRRTIDTDASKLLRLGWQTELAARLGEQLDDPGLRQATLQTLPVQAYYSVFSLARAFTVVGGAPLSGHASIHNAFARQHIERIAGAWGVSLYGDPRDPQTCVLTPAICVPATFNPIGTRADPAEYVWAGLRMARRWKYESSRQRWLADRKNKTRNGKRYMQLPRGRRAELIKSERRTTLLDFLYELRCSTNYRSNDEYSANVKEEHVNAFHRGLLHILDMGLLAYESQIALYTGSAALEREYLDWSHRLAGLGSWAVESGTERLAAIEGAGI